MKKLICVFVVLALLCLGGATAFFCVKCGLECNRANSWRSQFETSCAEIDRLKKVLRDEREDCETRFREAGALTKALTIERLTRELAEAVERIEVLNAENFHQREQIDLLEGALSENVEQRGKLENENKYLVREINSMAEKKIALARQNEKLCCELEHCRAEKRKVVVVRECCPPPKHHRHRSKCK